MHLIALPHVLLLRSHAINLCYHATVEGRCPRPTHGGAFGLCGPSATTEFSPIVLELRGTVVGKRGREDLDFSPIRIIPCSDRAPPSSYTPFQPKDIGEGDILWSSEMELDSTPLLLICPKESLDLLT